MTFDQKVKPKVVLFNNWIWINE